MSDGGFAITGADKIERARWLAVRSMLKIEIKTGMKHSSGVSALKLANQITGISARSKRKAYEALNKLITDTMGEEFNKPLT